jgi:uncharacterized protein (TIGR02449 family)
MIESELDDLESKIDKLIALLKQVKLENNSLHKKNTSLSIENTHLLDKEKKAAGSLKNLITQLQDELCLPQK